MEAYESRVVSASCSTSIHLGLTSSTVPELSQPNYVDEAEKDHIEEKA